ncbi:hypothetical protein ES319_A10G197100v1 [Gossypium barbadense]|uniref:Uncharacterized protein n=1 Tax=Gossypium barbadense TaxID=3634 RepID=A0A5J5U650_GOSBA|nr:hypothetical protein ES319_A10G197100v1 [Gossypium barbadense]
MPIAIFSTLTSILKRPNLEPYIFLCRTFLNPYSVFDFEKRHGHLVRKGTGGRSSVNGIIATVFGATGFLGRYLVQQLAKMESQVLVPFRGSEDNPRHLKLMGDLGQILPMKYDPRDENSIKAVIAKANVVINLIRREYETRNFSFEEVNHFMAEQLAMVAFVAFVTSTIFLRTKLHPVDEINGNLYLSCLLFGVVHMMFNGFSELSLLIFRLPIFYKQRDNLFHPAWIWSVVSWSIRVPYSAIEAVV